MTSTTIDLSTMTYAELNERIAEDEFMSGYRSNHWAAGPSGIYRRELQRWFAEYGYDGVMAQTFAEWDAEAAASMTERELVTAIVVNPDASVERAELARRRQAVGAQAVAAA